MTFPSYHPTDRRYVHGAWPISRHKFMSNTEQRVLHATAKTGQEIRLTYSNQTTEVVQQFLYHYDAMYGMQYAFELPDEVYAGWTESKKLMGNKQLWQYKDVPRITSQKGEIATLQVTLVAAPTQAIRAPEPAADGGGGGDGGGGDGGDDPNLWLPPPPPEDDPPGTRYKFTVKAGERSISGDIYWCDTERYCGGTTPCIKTEGPIIQDNEVTMLTTLLDSYGTDIRIRTSNCTSITNCGTSDSGSFTQEPIVTVEIKDWSDGRDGEIVPGWSTPPGRQSGPNPLTANAGERTLGNDDYRNTGATINYQGYILDVRRNGVNIGNERPDDWGQTATRAPITIPRTPNAIEGRNQGDGVGDCPPVTPLPPLPPGPGPGDGTYEPTPNPGGGYPGGGGSGGGSGGGPSSPPPSPSPGPGTPAPTPEPEPVCVDFLGNEVPCPLPPTVFPADPPAPGTNKYPAYFWTFRVKLHTMDKGATRSCYDNSLNGNPVNGYTGDCMFGEQNITAVAVRALTYTTVQYKVCAGTIGNYPTPPQDYILGLQAWNCQTGEWEDQFVTTSRVYRDNVCADSGSGNTLVTSNGSSAIEEQVFYSDGVWAGYIPQEIILEQKDRAEQFDCYGDYAPPIGPNAIVESFETRQLDVRNTANTTRFPDYHPSSRTYELADWNTKRFPGAMSGQAITIPLTTSSVASDGKLALTFANRGDAVAQDILRHYHAFTGGFETFQLSQAILADWNSVYSKTLREANWIYDAPPQVTTNHTGTSTTSVRLAITKASTEIDFDQYDPIGLPGVGEPSPPLPPLPPDPGNGDGGNGGGGNSGPDGPTPTPSPGPGDPSTPEPSPEPSPAPDPGDPGIPNISVGEDEILYPEPTSIRVEVTNYAEGGGYRRCDGSPGGEEPEGRSVVGYTYYTYNFVKGIRWYTESYFTAYTCNRSQEKIYPLKPYIVIETLNSAGTWDERLRTEAKDKIIYSLNFYSIQRDVIFKEITNVRTLSAFTTKNTKN